MFSSIIMIISLLNITVKTKHQNQFTMDIPSLVSVLIYNNSASSVLLVYNPNHNITSSTDLSNNFLFSNNHEIPFLWTSLRDFHHSLGLTPFFSQLTSSPSRQSLSLPMIPSCLFVFYMFSKHGISFYVTSNRGSEFVSNFFYSLNTALDIWLYFTSGYYSKDDRQTEYTNQTLKQYLEVYYNYQQNNQSKLLQSSLTIMLEVLLLVFLHFLLIRDIIQTSPFTLNTILLSPKSMTLLQISMSYRIPSKLKSLQPNCNNLKLKLRLQLRQRLERSLRDLQQVVKHTDTGIQLCYIYQ